MMARIWLMPGSLVQDERDLHVDLILRDLVVLDRDPHLLDPGALDVPQGPGGPLDALLNGVLEALARRGAQLGDLGDGHDTPPFEMALMRCPIGPVYPRRPRPSRGTNISMGLRLDRIGAPLPIPERRSESGVGIGSEARGGLAAVTSDDGEHHMR